MAYGLDFLTGGTATSSGGFQTPDKGFDDNTATYYQNYNSVPCWVKYDLGSGAAKVGKQYTITLSSYGSQYCPSAWVLEGSNNDSDWTQLDSRSGITWSSAYQKREFEFSNDTAYRYYRWTFSAPDGTICIAEFEVMGTLQADAACFLIASQRNRFMMSPVSLGLPSGLKIIKNYLTLRRNRLHRVGVSMGEYIPTVPTEWNSPTMKNDTTPSPYIVSASYVQDGGKIYQAFDRSASTYWGTSGGGTGPQWAKMDCGTYRPVVTGYSVKSYAGYGPKNVILQVSDNDSDWTNIDSRLLANNGDVQTFNVSNVIGGRYIRLYCTDSYTPGNQATYEITFSGYTMEEP